MTKCTWGGHCVIPAGVRCWKKQRGQHLSGVEMGAMFILYHQQSYQKIQHSHMDDCCGRSEPIWATNSRDWLPYWTYFKKTIKVVYLFVLNDFFTVGKNQNKTVFHCQNILCFCCIINERQRQVNSEDITSKKKSRVRQIKYDVIARAERLGCQFSYMVSILIHELWVAR